MWGVVLLFALVIGGIYGGVFTATEGAGVGAAGAFMFALLRGSLTPRVLTDILIESARTTAMLFTILIAAMIFSNFVNFTSACRATCATSSCSSAPTPSWWWSMMMVIYVVLGLVMEELSMVLLTIPVFFPVITGTGLRPGVVRHADRHHRGDRHDLAAGGHEPVRHQLAAAGREAGHHLPGVWPFVVADVVRLGILIAFPAIALWLPGLMR